MRIYNTKAELLALSVAELVEIVMYQACVMEIPEVKVMLQPQSIKNAAKKCQCCSETCCIKVPDFLN